MSQTNTLLNIVEEEDIDLHYLPVKKRNRGFYGESIIMLSQNIETESEHACILAEEIGHYYTTTSVIIDQRKIENQKQEKKARNWAHNKLLPLERIIDCYNAGCRNRFETSEFLDVTEAFLEEALIYYKEKYGICVVVDDHVIYFDPLGVMKKFNNI